MNVQNVDLMNITIPKIYLKEPVFSVATSEDSPVAMKLKKMWLKTPVSEEQAVQAVMDPAIGNRALHKHIYDLKPIFFRFYCSCPRRRTKQIKK